MPAKLTHDQFSQQLHSCNTKVTLIGSYTNAYTNILVKCNFCFDTFLMLPSSIKKGCGCARCSWKRNGAKLRLTHEEYFNRMKSMHPTITILGTYQSASIKVDLFCQVCNHPWSAIPNASLRGNGCPKCKGAKISKAQTKSHDEFVAQFAKVSSTIELLGSYEANKKPIEVKCKTCAHVWKSRPYNLLTGYGCRKCADKKNGDLLRFDHQHFLSLVKAANPYLQITGQYVEARKGISFNCLKCGQSNQKAIAFILSKGRGCYTCGRKVTEDAIRISESEFLARVQKLHPSIKVLGNYKKSAEKIACACGKCGLKWSPLAGSLLSNHGCPACSKTGFHPNRPSTFYAFTIVGHF